MLVSVFTFLSGCSSLAYYGQSVIGHSKLMLGRVSLDKAIRDAQTNDNDQLLEQLQLAKELRQFSIEYLALPDNASYSSYVDLDREFPVWTVVAAQEFSTKAEQWCYPVIGCASYRGYFSKAAAQKYALRRQGSGLETHVGAAGAYSTLGWFSDPLLPSMMRYGPADFAETLFHELAHQVLYIQGDSGFNEAFATVVGEHGALQWLKTHQPTLLSQYKERLAIRNDFSALLARLKGDLEEVYSSDIESKSKRIEKSKRFRQFKNDYHTIKINKWNGLGDYDAWIDQGFNNAKLASFGTYRDKVPNFEKLLNDCDNDFSRFYQSVRVINRDRETPIIPEQCI